MTSFDSMNVPILSESDLSQKENWENDPYKLDVNQLTGHHKLTLLKWQYREEGRRLSSFIPLIPHVDEPEPLTLAFFNESDFATSHKVIQDVLKKIQMQYIYAKQKFDELQEEKDVLKWQLVNLSKYQRLYEGEINVMLPQKQIIESKIKTIQEQNERLYRQRTHLSLKYQEETESLEQAINEYKEAHELLENWLTENDHSTVKVTEKLRDVSRERRLRYRQWQKLAHACALDRKTHTSLEYLKIIDRMMTRSYEYLKRFINEES